MGYDAWKALAGRKQDVHRMHKSKATKNGSAATSSGRKKSGKASRKSSEQRYPTSTKSSKAMEARWRAESDAQVLAQTSEILKSPERVTAAKRIAEEKAEAARTAADAIKSVRAGG